MREQGDNPSRDGIEGRIADNQAPRKRFASPLAQKIAKDFP
jgi:hypothetical protein